MSLIKNRKVWIALMLCLATVLWVSLAMPAEAATVTSGNGTWISGKLTYTYSVTSDGTSANGATGSVSASSGTLTVKAVSSKFVDGGCNADTNAFSTTTTVTVTNASSYPLKITTLTSSSATVTGVSQGQTIASGATFTITVTANPNSTSDTSSRTTTGTVTISVEEQTSVTITLASSPYVSYTVNGKTVAQNGTDQTFTTNAGTSISLPTITAPNGYEFKGWRIGGNLITSSSFTADAGYTVFPVIVTSGTNITAANFKVGSNTYTFWDDAVAAAVSGGGTIFVNATSVTLPANVLDNLLPAAGGTYVKPVSGDGVEYILPAGVTLVVPYNTSTTVHTTTPAYSTADHVAPSAFRTLTVPSGAKITVNGSVSVDSLVSAVGQNASSWNGTPSGPHGKIVMKSGSEMTFNSGANLYCYGYINGDGNIYIKSGANVYELFQLRCWRGGSATSGMPDNSYKVFPMNQYYVQNVEAAMTLYYGAKEYVWTVANMNSSAYAVQSPAEFIGSGGMFRISNGGSVTKKYHANTDHLEIEVNGNMSIGKMYLMIPISVLIMNYDVEIKTENYVLPITNNMDITIHSGTTSIDSSQKNGIAFLPGSVLTVDEGATFNMNAPVYVYDVSEWGKYGAGDCDIVPVGYSTANGTTTIRTINNIGDAVLDINGTLTVGNKLYTTASGANITSSTGTGEVKFTSAPATDTTTTYQATQSGTDITYVPITCNNAWLQNGDESHSQTVSTGVSNWYYDKPGEHWYRYTVDFLLNDNPDAIARDYYCENNDSITYDASWLANLGASVTSGTATAAISGTDVNVTGVSTNAVVTLTGTPAEYIPTFVLNEKQYSIYQLYTGNTLSDTTTIGGNTYYIVNQAESALAVGTTYAAPTDASMGITAANHNTITWNMSGISVTSGNPYLGTVPRGETAGGPSYVYGFYTGVVAHNSWNDEYYDTLIGAFEVLPQDAKNVTITLLADCGTFEEENSTVAYATYPDNNITLNLNGHKAVGRIVNQGTFTLELNGGTLDFHTGATAMAATYKGLATVINSGTMTIQDTAGGGAIKSDAKSNAAGADGSAVIRNNAGATLTITGKSSDELLTILSANEHEEPYNSSYGYYAYNYGIYNLGRITALTNVDITTTQSRTTGVNVYNHNTGVIDLISGGHMFAYSGSSVFNYGGTITTIDGLTIDGKNGIVNRNIRGGSLANGYTVANADKGIIDTITNCYFEVGRLAINNNAVINTISNSTFIAHPDSAQVDTRGNGLSTASDGNDYCYTIFNNNAWWYDTNVWKRTDTTAAPFTRTDEYKEEEQYRPTIGTITNCEIYAEITSNSASHGYALVNYGVIGKIGGTTNIKTYKHPSNGLTSFSTGHYTLHNLNGGIIKSIEGTVNISATGVGTVYNDGAFTTQINYTYGNKVGGNITYQKNTYGEPSTINSITCSGTWSCGGSSSYYYALYNTGYIQTINAPDLTLEGGYNVLYNAANGANSTYEITKKYTDGATASTEYERDTHYVKNLTKGSTIGTINGITVTVKGTKVYQGINNQGHIGTLSNVTVDFASGATNNTSSYPLVLNGDSRYKSYTETILTNRTSETDPHLTVTAGVVTRYDRDYTYDTATIDLIDNLTVTSIGTYAFRNAGHIGTLKNSTITGTQYSLHNYANGPYTERQTRQYYSGTGIFTTSKNAGELNIHYKRNAATIDLIDNCTITTPANTYAMFNSGHVGTIKNSTLQAGTTTAKAYALANSNSQEREYTRDLETILYVTANKDSACTAYYGSGGETDVVVYDYDQPTIALIGEGNTFKATSQVIANTGIITAIDSGEGTLTTITGSAAKGSTIYNYSCVLDTRTTTTPYTAATAASTSGTKGTAVNEDTNQSGAQIDTIKNVYINANGYGILNGDATTGKTPTIGEIGEGTEIYAHCTTAGYHAIYNQANAKVSKITGGVYTVTKATTNAYKNNNTAEGYATVITGGDFKGMSATRANAIFEPDNTSRQTYGTTEAPKVLSANSRSVNFNNGTTVASGTGYYYINDAYTVTFNMQGHGTAPDAQTVESGQKATAPTAPAANVVVTEDGKFYRFDGWFKEEAYKNAFDFSTAITTDNFTVTDGTVTAYAKWTEIPPVAQIGTTNYLTLADAVAAAQNGDTVTMLADETLSALVAIEGKSITLDLNGHTVSRSTKSAIQVKETGTLTVQDSAQNGTIQATEAKAGESDAIVVLSGGTLTLESGTIRSNTYGISSLGTVTVTGGTVIGVAGALFTPANSSGTIAVSGGWFSHAVNSAYCDAGYHPSTDETHDPKYTVSNLYTVTFNANGHGTAPAAQSVEYGQKATAPTAPTADGYTFEGWYKEAACTNAWSFSTDTVTADTELFAKWTAEATSITGATVTVSGTYTYTGSAITPEAANVTVELNGTTLNYGTDYTFTASSNTSAGEATVTVTGKGNYKDTATGTFTIGNASQAAPTGLTGVKETYKGQGNGSITGVTTAMEYRKGTTGSFTKVTAAMLTDGALIGLEAGSYEVRFAAKTNYNASPAASVTVGEGEMITITWSVEGSTSTSEVEYGDTPSYSGATPTKAATAQYTYTFSGWSPAPAAVTGPTTYTAQFSGAVNTYTVTWTMGDGASDAEIKAAVDAVIADAAQSIYNDAHTEGDMAWSFLSHENLVKMHLDAGGVPTTNSSDAYIAKRIIAIVENGSADFTAADALWDTCKETIADDFAAFTGYTSGETGTTYNGLTAAQVSALEAVPGGATVLETDENVAYGETPTYDGETPTKAGDAQYSYTFSGWSPEVSSVIGDATYAAQFTQSVNEYTITWLDGDGETLKTEQVAYGATPSYSGSAPTKTATAQYTYTFNNTWTPAITAVTGTATYTAQFDSTVNEYTITFLDEDGETVLQSSSVAYGETPAYTGAMPTKAATAQYTYTFGGWDQEIVAVTGAATYTATYTSTVNQYTVTFENEDGTELSSESYAYGTLPAAIERPADPTKASTAQYEYSFAGWTPSIATVTGNATYTATYSSKKLISYSEITVSIPNQTYTGEALTPVVTVTDGEALIEGTDYTITLPAGRINAGNYTVTITGTGSYAGSRTATFTIDRKAATVTADGKTKIYGAADPVLTATENGVVEGDTLNYTLARATGEDVGTYTITVTLGMNPNYDLAATNGAFTITQKAITIRADSETKAYDGTALTKDTYTSTALATDDVIESVTVTGSQTDVGSSDNVPSAAVIKNGETDVTANYNINYANGTLTVTQAQTNTVTVNITGWTYGEAANAPTSTATFGAADYYYKVKGAEDSTYTTTVPTNAGEYTVSAYVEGTDNYVAGYATKDFVIAQKTLTITADSDTKVYDGTSLTKNSYTNTALAHGDAIESVTVTGNQTVVGSSANVPSAAVIKNDDVNVTANYDITYTNGTLTVTKAMTNTVTVDITGWTYGDTANVPTSTATFGSATYYYKVKDADDSTYTTTVPTNAGEYTVSAYVTGTDDYVGGSAQKDFTIAQKALTITADSDTKVYDGTALQKQSYTNTVLATGDAIESVTVTGSQTVVGTSNNVPSAAVIKNGETDVTANYDITYANGTLTVTQAETNTVMVDITGWTYGEAANAPTSTATFGTASYTYSDAEDGTYTATVPSTAGMWYVKATVAGTDNYVGGSAVKSFTIAQKALTITADSDTKVYDGTALRKNTYTNTTLAEGDAIESVTVTGSQKYVGTSDNVPSAAVIKNGETDVTANYAITYVNGTLTVTGRNDTEPDKKYEITVAAKSGTATYDGTEHSVSGLVATEFTFNGETYTVFGLSASVTGTDAGTYTVTVTGTAVVKDSDGENVTDQFIVNKTPGTLTINKRSVTLTSATDSREYNGRALTNHNVDVSGDGFVTGEGATYSVTGSQRVVGSSANTFTYELNPNTKADNYNITKSEGTLTVTRRTAQYEISPQANSNTFKYDGQAHEVSGFVSDTFEVEGETYTISGLTATATLTNAGEDTVSVTGTAVVTDSYGNDVSAQFSVTPLTGTLTITKREVTLTSASDSKEYDGTALTNSEVTVTGDGFADGEGATYSVTGTRTLVGSAENTFSYTLNAGTSADNYTITTNNGSLTVTSRSAQYEVTLTANSGEYKYDGSEKTVTGWTIDNGAGGSFTAENGLTYTVEGMTAEATGINAGSYTVNVTGTPVVKDSDGNNVTEQFAVNTVSGALSITKRAVTLTSATDSKAYDGSALTNSNVTVTGDGFATGEGATYNVTGSQTLPGYSANAFTYTLNEGTLADNYNISTENGTLTINDRTDKYEITVEANSGEYTYDGTEKAVSGFKALEYTIDGVTYTVSGLTAEVSGTNAGTYTATVTGTPVVKDAGGNDLTAQFHVTTRNGTLTIDPVAATVTADEKSKVYGDSDPDLTATITGVVEGESLNYTLARAEGENVGEYAITVTLGENPNYDVTPMNGTFTITKKAATVTADAKSKTYGDSDPDLTATVTGLVGSDKLNYTLARAEGEDVGSYDITVTLGSNPNYEVTATNGTFTITRATATVTADAKTKVYGAADPTLTAAVTGLQNGDAENVITYTLTRAEGEDVGEYTITPAGDTVQGNYNVEYVTGTLEITKATATVTANDASKVAGNADPAFTAVVTGLQNGDTESVITYTVSRETGETVGTYAITPAGDAVQGNYNVTYVPGTFTIESAVVSVTHDETVTYFADFKEAVEAAQANDTITVLADFTIDESKTETTDRIVITKPVTIDFGAYTMSVPGALEPTSNWAALYVDADTTIRATTGGIDCIDKENGECGVYAINVRNNATLTIESGSYHGGGTVAQAQLGTINVTGGTFTATPFEAPYGMNFVFNCSDAAYTAGNASIAITGGTFVGFDPQCNAAEGANTRFVPANYVAIDDGSGSFTVQPGGTITFDLAGGSGTGDYSEQRIPSGGTVTEPAAPTKEACVFSGWLLDGEAYDFTTPVTGDITLTANWGHAVAMIGRVGYATLPEAIAAAQASGTTIRMVDDITVTAAVVFPADKDITLNLAGHSITGDLPKSNILTVNGGLTVTDSSDPSAGLIENTGSTNNNAKTINVGNSGTFTLESGTLRGAKRTIYTSGTGTIVVNGGTVTTTASGGFGTIYGGHVTVNGGTISAPNDNFAISPRTLMVTDGTISGGKYGVYLSSTYSGSFGTVTGGTITGGSSYAISLGSKSSLKITGGTLNSADGFVGINLGGTGCITADSGAAYVENSNACATVVDENDNILVEGYYGIIGVGQLSEAEGNTVKLLKDVEITSQVVINKSTTLDLNGHSITRTGTTTNSNFSAIQVTKGDVTITGNGTVTAVDDGNGPGVSAVTVNGSPVHLTIESGEFIVNGNNTAVYIQKGNTAANPNTVTITGGAFRTTDGDPGFLLNILDSQREKAQFIVQGGTFYGFDPQDNAAEGANTRFVPADYVAINDGEGNFTVQAGGTITFDLNGGTGTGDYSEQRIPSGQTVTEPSPVPVKANYQFKEWQQGGVAYDFDTAVTGDFELVAAYDEAVARIGDDYYATLSGAVAAAESGDTIILLSDSSGSRVTISKSLTLDLNDYTFTGRVTIDNGTVTVENGTIVGRFDTYDNATVTLASTATVNGQAVVWGDGTYGEAGCKTPTLNVYGTITNTGETAISTNGTDKSGAIINIYDGAVLTSTDDIAIYLPSGNLNIEGGSITGTTAVYAKSGSVTVTGGTLTATGAAAEYSFNGNGGNSTGDALVIESCGYPNGDPTVSVTGGTFVSANAQAIASYATEGNTAAEHFVSGGEFNTVLDVSIVEEGSQCTTTLTNENGYYYIVDEITVTFTVDGETYATAKIPTGEAIPAAEIPTNPTSATRLFAGWYANETAYDLSTATFSSDTTLTAAWTDAVAQIGSTPYASLSEAIAAAQAGDTVKLLQNASESRVTISKSLTLDLDGNIFTGRVTIDNGTVTVEDGEIVGRFDAYDNATVTLAADATVTGQAVVWGDGTYGEAGCKTPTLNVYGTITNTGDTAISTNGTDTSGAVINIYDGAVVTSTDDLGIYLPSGNLTVSGGEITGTTAVYAKSGSVDISGGILTGNGAAADYSYNGNGANATGDALVIDTCGYPNGDPTVSVTGGTFVSTNGKAIASYATEGNTAAAGFVEDGEFNTPLDVAIVADGYQCTTTLTNENGYYYIVEDVTVTFDANGGSDVEAVKLPKGEAVDEPTTSRTGYTFDAWQLNGADYDFTAAVTEDIELTATWTPIPYTITWKNYDGSVIDETTVDYDATPTHDNATRADDADYHYTFNGWTPEIVAVTGDAEYTATYTTTDRSYGQPVWTWDGTESATASFTTNDGYAEFTLTETADGAAITHETTTAETCETDGAETYTATVTFRGTEYTDQTTEIRAALGHDYTYYYIWNTDNTSVIARRVCENDHSHTNYERVATTSEVTKTATCEEEGEITYTATFTAEYFETQTKVVATPKTHTYEPVWVWLDSETAYVEVRCSNCNDLLTRIAADITETITKEATCTEAGEKTYTATAVYNGETLTDTWSETVIVPATGHTLTAHEATTVTCEVAGNSAYWSCESCGKYFSDAEGTTEIEADSWIIPAIGHDWNEPTYSDYDEDAGTVTATRTCKNDPSHVEVETAQVDETAYTVPTCTEAGSRTLTAAFENEAFSWMRTVEIPANGHSLTAHEANEPTCTEIGNSAYWSCDVCGKYFSDANGATEIEDNSWIISSTGHSYGEPLWTWNGNDADGYTSAIATFTCTKCDHVETIADDELDYMVTVEATEAAPGSATYTAIVELDGETYTGTKTVDVPYVKLDYPNFTIVGVVQSFRPEEVENIVTVTDSLAGKFNITYDMACMVAVKTIEIVDGEEIEHYQMLHCTEFEGEENTYAYDLSELEYTFESDIEIIVAIKGDINGDGRLTSRDATMISRALLTEGNEQRLTLDGLSAFMADTTQDGRFTSRDKTRLSQALLTGENKKPFDWDLAS